MGSCMSGQNGGASFLTSVDVKRFTTKVLSDITPIVKWSYRNGLSGYHWNAVF